MSVVFGVSGVPHKSISSLHATATYRETVRKYQVVGGEPTGSSQFIACAASGIGSPNGWPVASKVGVKVSGVADLDGRND